MCRLLGVVSKAPRSFALLLEEAPRSLAVLSEKRIRSRVPDCKHRPRSAPSASLLLRSGAHIAEYAPLRCSSRLAAGAAFGRVGP
jgi:hypothetical protein